MYMMEIPQREKVKTYKMILQLQTNMLDSISNISVINFNIILYGVIVNGR